MVVLQWGLPKLWFHSGKLTATGNEIWPSLAASASFKSKLIFQFAEIVQLQIDRLFALNWLYKFIMSQRSSARAHNYPTETTHLKLCRQSNDLPYNSVLFWPRDSWNDSWSCVIQTHTHTHTLYIYIYIYTQCNSHMDEWLIREHAQIHYPSPYDE